MRRFLTGVFFNLLLLLSSCFPEKPVAELKRPGSRTTLINQRIELLPVPAPEKRFSEMEEYLSSLGLVEPLALDSSLLVDLRYSDTSNFLKRDVYGDLERLFLQPEVAERVVLANKILRSEFPRYRLLLFDGVRPLSIQKIMWQSVNLPVAEKTQYLSNPATGSIHNYGAAIDLSIADENEKELDMGTPYDFFGDEAQPQKERQMIQEGRLDSLQLKNRLLLRRVMQQAGFRQLPTEWWHFNACSRSQAASIFKIIP